MEKFIRNRTGFATLDRVALVVFVALVCLIELFMLVSLISLAMYMRSFNPVIFSTLFGMVFVLVLACAWAMGVMVLSDIAREKGANTSGLQFIGLVSSPIVLALIVIAMPTRNLAAGSADAQAPLSGGPASPQTHSTPSANTYTQNVEAATTAQTTPAEQSGGNTPLS
jgi:magnesium-transporting ATPase (P-type)